MRYTQWKGQTLNITDICTLEGVCRNTINSRIHNGMTVEEAVLAKDLVKTRYEKKLYKLMSPQAKKRMLEGL